MVRLLIALSLALCLQPLSAKSETPFLQTHCIDCHDEDVKKGGLDLTSLAADDVAAWTKVHDRVASGEMPPAKKPRPAAAEQSAYLASLAMTITETETALRSKVGRTVFRRLNRTEYENTLRDLLGLPHLNVREMLPADGEAHGFDTVGAALNLSHVQVARYLEAADAALDAALQMSEVPVETRRVRLKDEGRFYELDQKTRERIPGGRGSSRVVDEWIVLLRQPNSAQTPWFFGRHVEHSGDYKVRIRLRAVEFANGKLQPPAQSHIAALVGHPSRRVIHQFNVPTDAEVLEFTAWIEAGEQLTFNALTLDDRISPGETKIDHTKPYSGPGIAVEYVETVGPQLGPKPANVLFGGLPIVPWTKGSSLLQPSAPAIVKGAPRLMVASPAPEVDASRVLRNFMERAFRRSVSEAELADYLPLVKARLAQKVPFHEALRTGFKAVICSPDFLFFQERRGGLDDPALAARLSYFLWKSMPDQQLLQANLHDSQVLHEQTERLLSDPRSQRFVHDFLDQWLELRRIAFTQPDKQLYPEFDMLLQDSMVEETRAYFSDMLRHDLSAGHVLKSDFLYVNAPLAALYGVPGIKGVDLQRVPLPAGSVRGGFITQGSVLKVTANGTTTSPVTRGAWIMERILGKHVPPPPPGAGSIEPDVRGTTTVREQLDKHRSIESCAGCHRKIDPPGFALESFDVMGGWRERYRSLDKGEKVDQVVADRRVKYRLGLPVDTSGHLEDGAAFSNIREFRELLLKDQPQLARNLTERLFVYATGAGITFSDRAEVERVVAATAKSSHGLRSMIHEIIQSPLFLCK
jgi:hypothetical protein